MLTALLLLSCMTPVQAQTEKETTCFAAQNSVVLDGRWTTPEEWQDSEQIVLTAHIGRDTPYEWTGNGTAYSRTKHDNNFLYVLIDFVSATKAEKDDGALVMLDGDHDAGTVLDNDDMGFQIVWASTATTKLDAYRGDSGSWVSIPVPGSTQAASSLDASNDPNSDTRHPTYEFKIPMSLFKSAEKIGFSAGVFQLTAKVLMLWPQDRSKVGPDTWGELAFSAVAVPEFSGLASPIVMFISACLSLLILRKTRKTDERKSDWPSCG